MSEDGIKLNLGCGSKIDKDYVNVDKYGDPDIRWDLEEFPWPWEDNTASEVMLNHVLEHLGQDPNVFIQIIKELYRVCKHEAIIKVRVPHPRHNSFLSDPTHVRPITGETMQLFNKEENRKWVEVGAANSTLGLYHDVDLRILEHTFVICEEYEKDFIEGRINKEDIHKLEAKYNNVVKEISMKLQVVKE